MKRLAILLVLFAAMMILQGCATPLRVGTVGAKYYHRLDCPSVQRSWAQADRKPVYYYSWWQIWFSGRVADHEVCMSDPQDDK